MLSLLVLLDELCILFYKFLFLHRCHYILLGSNSKIEVLDQVFDCFN